MDKVLLGVVGTLKVHEKCGKRGGSASLLVDGERKIKT